MSKKKDHKKAIKRINEDRERIGDVLGRVSMAYVDVYKRMNAEGATPEQMFAVSKAGMAFALAARVVRGDIELEFLHAPAPAFLRDMAETQADPDPTQEAESVDPERRRSEGEGGHTGMYL